MTDAPEHPLARWSRRKAAHRRSAAGGDEDAIAPAPPATAGGETAAAIPVATPAAPGEPAADPWPDPAALTAASDFSVFLGADVPDDVHRQAMRALWKSDPLITAHDGLTDYNDDYQAAGCFSGIVKTAYRVGRGLLADPPQPPENTAAAAAAGGQAEAADAQPEAPDAVPDAAPDAGPETASDAAPDPSLPNQRGA